MHNFRKKAVSIKRKDHEEIDLSLDIIFKIWLKYSSKSVTMDSIKT